MGNSTDVVAVETAYGYPIAAAHYSYPPQRDRPAHFADCSLFGLAWRSRHVFTKAQEELTMARSIRVLYRGVQGRVRRNFNWPPISEKSAVIITAAEWAPAGGIFGVLEGRPHLGAANVYVTNVGPHDPEGGSGGVEFHLHADSDAPLDVIVTISVLDEVEQFVAA